MTIYVQFSDESESAINGAFSDPQPGQENFYQGAVETNDPRYKTFYDNALAADKPYLPTPT